MAKGRGTQIDLDPPKTVATIMTDPFVPGWDDRPGALPQRLQRRHAMGKKMTPIGRGTLRRKGG